MARQGIERQRGERRHPTRIHQQRYNQACSQRRLVALVAENFAHGAVVITLHNEVEWAQKAPWRAKGRLGGVIRALRSMASPAPCYVWGCVSNLDTLAYQIVTEAKSSELEHLVELWDCGRVTIEHVEGESLIQTVQQWVNTTSTERDGWRQWTASRNIKRLSMEVGT